MKLIRLLLLGSALICGNTFAAEMVKIEGGSYRPLYLKKETSLIKVKPFQLDKYPVTNATICLCVPHLFRRPKKAAIPSSTAKAALVIKLNFICLHSGSLSYLKHIWIAGWYGCRSARKQHSWMGRLSLRMRRYRTFVCWMSRLRVGCC